jgi:ferredoxin
VRIDADYSRCAASGQCVLESSLVFAQDDETGVVVVTFPESPESEREAVLRAIAHCPTQALRLVRE